MGSWKPRSLPFRQWVLGISGEREEHEDGEILVCMETNEQPLGHAQGSWGVEEAVAKGSWEDGLGQGDLKLMQLHFEKQKPKKTAKTTRNKNLYYQGFV